MVDEELESMWRGFALGIFDASSKSAMNWSKQKKQWPKVDDVLCTMWGREKYQSII
jgi:hypothetical protein